MSLAKTVFSTGIEEKLAAVDAYGVRTGLESLNNGEVGLTGNELLGGFLGGNLGDSQAVIKGLDAQNRLLLDKVVLKNNLLSASPALSGALSGLSSSMSGSLLNTNLPSSIQASINGVSTLVNNSDLSSLKSLGQLVGQVSGSQFNILFKDQAGLVALGGNLIKQASSLGIPGAYTQIANGMLSVGDSGLLMQITRGVLPAVIGSGNVHLLQEIASGPIGKQIGQLFPDTAGKFLSAFKLNPRSRQASPTELAFRILTTFKILKPDWNRTRPASRRGKSTGLGNSRRNAAIISNASILAKKILTQASRGKVLPGVAQPRLFKLQNPQNVQDINLEFGDIVSNQSVSNADGTTTNLYQTAAGVRISRTTRADGKVLSKYTYPQKGMPSLNQWDRISDFIKMNEAPAYDPVEIDAQNQAALDRITVDASEFDQTSFGPGAIASGGVTDGSGYAERIYGAQGDHYTHLRLPSGEVIAQHIKGESSDSLDPSQPVDLFGNWAANTVDDDLSAAAVGLDAEEQARQWERDSGQRSYLTQDAAGALNLQFGSSELW